MHIKYLTLFFAIATSLSEGNSEGCDTLTSSSYSNQNPQSYGYLPPISSSPAIPSILNSVKELNNAASILARNPLDTNARYEYERQVQRNANAYAQLDNDAKSGKYDTTNLNHVLKQLGENIERPTSSEAQINAASNESVQNQRVKSSTNFESTSVNIEERVAKRQDRQISVIDPSSTQRPFVLEDSRMRQIMNALETANREGITLVVGGDKPVSFNPFDMTSFLESALRSKKPITRDEIREEIANRIDVALSIQNQASAKPNELFSFLQKVRSHPKVFDRFLDRAADTLFSQHQSTLKWVTLGNNHPTEPLRKLSSLDQSHNITSPVLKLLKWIGSVGEGFLTGLGLLFLILYWRWKRRSRRKTSRNLIPMALFLCSVSASGDSLTVNTALHAIIQSGPGVLHGEPYVSRKSGREIDSKGIVKGMDPDAHVYLVSRDEKGRPMGDCSGTMIEGCILTAAHCNELAAPPPKEWTVYMGEKPDIRNLIGIIPNTKEHIMKLTPGEINDPMDIAIMRPMGTLPFGLSRSLLSQEKPKRGDILTQIGYGVSDVAENQDVGNGKRRQGLVRVDGYFELIRGEDLENIRGKPGGDTVFVSPIKGQVGAPGDSGGSLLKNGKIVALLSGGSEKETEKAKFSIFPPARSDRMLYHTVAAISDNFDKIRQGLDGLQCNENLEAVQIARLNSSGVAKSLTPEAWAKLPKSEQEKIYAIFQRLLAPAPGKTLTLEPQATGNKDRKILLVTTTYPDGFKDKINITLDSKNPTKWTVRPID